MPLFWMGRRVHPSAYAAALAEWAEDSFQFQAFEGALQERVWKVLQNIPSYALGGDKEISKEDLGFFLVRHENGC